MPAPTITRRAAPAGRAPSGDGGLPPRARRRNLPLAVAGVLLVAGCALIFAVGWRSAGHREPVLALARTVPAGSVLSPADLQQVRISADAAARLVPAGAEATVVGRTAGQPLPAGTLLTFAALGAAGQPGAGQAQVGVQVSAGQYPPSLAAGATVEVLDAPSSSSQNSGSGSQGSGASAAGTPSVPLGHATVLGITQGAGSTGTATVAELQLPQPVVPLVTAAASAGQVTLALVPAGGP